MAIYATMAKIMQLAQIHCLPSTLYGILYRFFHKK
jgi:hypothetical protein